MSGLTGNVSGPFAGEAFTLEKLRASFDLVRNFPPMPPRVVLMENPWLTVTREDWSQVRSVGRAKRRRKQGHSQRIIVRIEPDINLYTTPDGFTYGHPVTIKSVRERLGGAA